MFTAVDHLHTKKAVDYVPKKTNTSMSITLVKENFNHMNSLVAAAAAAAVGVCTVADAAFGAVVLPLSKSQY